MTRSPIQDEAAFLQEQREALQRRVPEHDPTHRLFEVAHARMAALLRAPVDDDYLLPAHFAKTMAPVRLRELRELLTELKGYCTGLTGMSSLEAGVLTNGDETVLFLREALTDVMLAHAKDRLGKPSVRDRDQPFERWFRLMGEFGWWFNDLSCAGPPGHYAVIGGTHRRIVWELFQATWSCNVEVRQAAGHGIVQIRGIKPDFRDTALRIIQLFGWDATGVTRAVIRAFPEVGQEVTGDVVDLRAELSAIANDLRDVKALLIRGYRPTERPIALPGGIVGAWSWETGQLTGSVELGRTVGALHQPFGEGANENFVTIGLDGRVEETLLPWVDLGDEAVRWAIGLLRPVRDRLVADWCAVERPTPVAEAVMDAVSEGEAVAVACEVLAEQDPDADDPDTEEGASRGPRTRHRVPKVRAHTLLLLMERHFGCEVKSSKGSEVTVYRPGGKKFTLGGKHRSRYMPSVVIGQMLRWLGIPASEFVAVVQRGRV